MGVLTEWYGMICLHLAKERYKRWHLLNTVKTNLILYIVCASTLHLQHLIPNVARYVFIPRHHSASVFGHIRGARCSFDMCSVCVVIW
jgi:hypothetical protein